MLVSPIILGLLFCSYKFTVGASITDFSGLIKNIQIIMRAYGLMALSST